MTATRRILLRLLWDPVIPRVATLVFVAIGLILPFSQALNHDVAWLLEATDRLLSGAAIYWNDVIEINPPLILYLFSPPVALHRCLDLPELAAFRVYVALLALLSIASCRRLLGRLLGPERGLLTDYLVAGVAYALFIAIDHHYGQREHFILILVLPYLILLALRATGTPSASGRPPLPRWETLGVGALSGLAFSIKPHYALVGIALELGLMLRQRSLRTLLRPELLAVLAVASLYIASVLLLTPAYLERMMPLSMATYWAYQRPITRIPRIEHLALLFVAAASWLSLRKDDVPARRALMAVLLASGLGFYAVTLLQRTGWRYNFLPAWGAALLASIPLGQRALTRLTAMPPDPLPLRSRALPAVLAGVLALGLALAKPDVGSKLRHGGVWRAGGASGEIREIADAIERHAGDGGVFFLSSSLRPGFPAVSYTRARWASRYSTLWFAPAVMLARSHDPRRPAWLDDADVDWIEQTLYDSVVEDLRRYEPQLILVPRRPSGTERRRLDMLEYFLRDPRFRAIWQAYVFTGETAGRYRVAVLRSTR